MKRINDIFPKWFTTGGQTENDFTGVISNLIYPYYNSTDRPNFQIPYNTSYFPAITYGNKSEWLGSLDVMFSSRFGNKKVVSWLNGLTFHNDPTKPVTSEERNNTVTIAKMINLRFADKWNHIAEALAIEYNPLENYDRQEDSSFEHGENGNDYNTTRHGYKLSGTGTATDPITESQDKEIDNKSIKGGWADVDTRATTTTGKYDKSTVNKDSVHGFNGTADFDEPGSPSEYSESTETYNYTPSESGVTPYAETNSGAMTRDYHGITGDTKNPHYNEDYEKTGSEYTKEHTDHSTDGWDTSHIHGNIGVTTSQQMLQSELDVRRNILYDIILEDIANFICLSIY